MKTTCIAIVAVLSLSMLGVVGCAADSEPTPDAEHVPGVVKAGAEAESKSVPLMCSASSCKTCPPGQAAFSCDTGLGSICICLTVSNQTQ